MNEVEIRKITRFDVPQMAEIISSTLLWQRYGIDSEKALAMAYEALASQQDPSMDSLCLVAAKDGLLMGFCWIQYRGCFGMSGYIKLLGVREQARRSGVGRDLLKAAEDMILSRGPNVFLLVSHFNTPAIEFYEKMGYVKIGAIKDYVITGVDELLYRKTIGPLRVSQAEEIVTIL